MIWAALGTVIPLLIALYRVWQTRNYAKLAAENGDLKAKVAARDERIAQQDAALAAYRRAADTPGRSFADIATGVREREGADGGAVPGAAD